MSKKLIFPYTLLCLAGVFLLLLFRNFTFASIENSLSRFWGSLIPSFFPIMVLSRQIYTNFHLQKGHFSNTLCKLSGIPQTLFPVFFASLLCGYPTSAILCKKALEDGVLSKKEAELATIIFSNASPAFVILLIGKGVFSDISVGIALFTIQTFCVICASHIFFDDKKDPPSVFVVKHEGLADSVTKATHSILELLGFVIFFSLVSDGLKKLLFVMDAPEIIAITLSGMIETTGGVLLLSDLPHHISVPLVCLFCATGGISVFFQISALVKVNILQFVRIRGTIFVFMALSFYAVLKLFEVLSLL